MICFFYPSAFFCKYVNLDGSSVYELSEIPMHEETNEYVLGVTCSIDAKKLVISRVQSSSILSEDDTTNPIYFYPTGEASRGLRVLPGSKLVIRNRRTHTKKGTLLLGRNVDNADYFYYVGYAMSQSTIWEDVVHSAMYREKNNRFNKIRFGTWYF
jgi:hypothetical protein